jgi:SAM-dependent methyltransferase
MRYRDDAAKCSRCGLIAFSLNRPSLVDGFDGWTAQRSWALADGRKAILSTLAQLVKGRLAGGKLLDIGCSVGTFLHQFSSPPWSLFGVDPSAAAVSAASSQHPISCKVGTVSDGQYPSGFFDAVTVLDCLYYMPDPRKDLAEAVRILKPGGMLIVEVPNMDYVLKWRSFLAGVASQKQPRLQYDRFHRYVLPLPALIECLLSLDAGISRIEPLGCTERREITQNLLQRALATIAIRLQRMTRGYVALAPKTAIVLIKRGSPVEKGDRRARLTYEIRSAVLDELAPVAGLRVENLPKGFAATHRSLLEQAYRRELHRRLVLLVAVRDGEVVGFVEAWLSKAMPGICSGISAVQNPARLLTEFLKNCFVRRAIRRGSAVEIRALVIAPAARGQGLAPQLVTKLMHELARVEGGRPYCWIRADNLPSLRTFLSHGFRVRAARVSRRQSELLLVHETETEAKGVVE